MAATVGIRPSREANVESSCRRCVGQRVRQVLDDRLVDQRVEQLEERWLLHQVIGSTLPAAHIAHVGARSCAGVAADHLGRRAEGRD